MAVTNLVPLLAIALVVVTGLLLVVIIVLLVQNTSLRREVSQQLDIARREVRVEIERWKSEHEQYTRIDAIQRSQDVIIGNVTQHLVPYFPDFQYNPNDVRFIGSPVDLIIFDGLSEGHLKSITFAEVKTGDAKLNGRQRQVREIIKEGKVTWAVVRVPSGLRGVPPEARPEPSPDV
jgi:predicted Holliday junction resolvase-like endonuclease